MRQMLMTRLTDQSRTRNSSRSCSSVCHALQASADCADVQLTADEPDEAGRRRYLPVLSPNEFWHLSSHLNPINETVRCVRKVYTRFDNCASRTVDMLFQPMLTRNSTLPLRIELHPVSMMRWQLFTTMTDAFEKSAAQNGGGGELDEIKRALIETSPWLLITTAVVTVLHMLFEMVRRGD